MAQYEAAQVQERNAEDPLERAKKDTRELMGTVMRLERENDQLAHELINGKIQLRSELDNAEDMNELQQKEIARLNCLVIDAEDETKRLRDEASMVKELCRNMENETRRIEESKSQYKQINLQLEKRLEIMTAKLHSVQNGLCKACKFPPDGDTAQSNCQTNPDEEKIKMLELELARTKLALVEKECYTQELLHQLNLASQGDQASKNSWLSKTTKSLGTMVGVGSSFERRTSGSASSVARNSFSNSKDTGVEREPSNSSHDLS
ncbi:hypothetical protein RvY_05841 [Ramazzottius varieornatus]|uniref:Uncharacterized protein n=1 Tax=Ramazzottius varieornatus TaxID=947166 RepID=A0A1D1V213_RAMVA|nr:hypothetical protein RvY_05841 [Ramazzottius varieornatus]